MRSIGKRKGILPMLLIVLAVGIVVGGVFLTEVYNPATVSLRYEVVIAGHIIDPVTEVRTDVTWSWDENGVTGIAGHSTKAEFESATISKEMTIFVRTEPAGYFASVMLKVVGPDIVDIPMTFDGVEWTCIWDSRDVANGNYAITIEGTKSDSTTSILAMWYFNSPTGDNTPVADVRLLLVIPVVLIVGYLVYSKRRTIRA